MDGKAIRNKLIGSDDQRAVSPVIGVILMVAITVILAAVIAAFVLDLGQSQSQEVQAGVQFEDGTTDSGNNYTTITWTSSGSADQIKTGGDADEKTIDSVGGTATLTCGTDFGSSTGTLTITAIASADDIDGDTSVGSREIVC